MKHNKAPGSDGFPTEFYQVFWCLRKDDLAMFRDFHARNLPLFYLNFGIITLLPKEKEVKKIQQYRPICMLNVSFMLDHQTSTICLLAWKIYFGRGGCFT
jgi:hypothetical protein